MATYDVDGTRERVDELVSRSLSGEKITISSAEGNVVMVSEEDWDSLVDALSVMLLPEVRDRLATLSGRHRAALSFRRWRKRLTGR